jgi:hypothetical protein
MCSVQPDDPMFPTAWDRADLVVAQGQCAAHCIRGMTKTPVTYWSMAYDEDEFVWYDRTNRDIDVCFVQRCSANNATHHEEYLRCMKWSTVFTDVTGYLKLRHPNLYYCTPKTYIEHLHRSKVVVSLYDSWYGGLSVREAIRAGCVPVVPDTPAHRELVGQKWLYCVQQPVQPYQLERVIDLALRDVNSGVCPPSIEIKNESYQVGSVKAVQSILELSTR